jgi:hypothetical protein
MILNDITKLIEEVELTQEGILGGLAGSAWETVSFKELRDAFELAADLKQPMKFIENYNRKLKEFVKDSTFGGPNQEPAGSIIKALQVFKDWRFYPILHDATYKELLSVVKKTGNYPLKPFDISLSKRAIPSLYAATTQKDLIKIIDTYSNRSRELYKYTKPGVGKVAFSMTPSGGILDFGGVIRKIVRYKG